MICYLMFYLARLGKLEAAGIILRDVKGNQVFFKANQQCPIFDELKSLVIKTVLAGNVLKDILIPLADRIDIAFLYGSAARREMGMGSDLDIMIVGNVSFAEAVDACSRVQEQLVREVNPTVYPFEEFKAKITGGHHFLTSVLNEDKIFIIGDEHELEKLVGE